MNIATPQRHLDSAFPLPELEALEVALRSFRSLLGHLEGASSRIDRFRLSQQTLDLIQTCVGELDARRHALNGDLERLTRPDIPRPPLKPRTWPGVTVAGDTCHISANVRIYLRILRHIQDTLPTRWEHVAASLARCGRCRRYVSRSREALFPGHSREWAEAHSEPLRHGWYADTNLSTRQIQALARHAVDAAGLRWGIDVVARWN